MYIHGDPNCGKSIVAKSILVEHEQRRKMFIPCNQNSAFFLSGLRQHEHELIVIDEFTPELYKEHSELFNLLLSGEHVAIDEKCQGKGNIAQENRL